MLLQIPTLGKSTNTHNPWRKTMSAHQTAIQTPKRQLKVELAETQSDIDQALSLRYKVFVEEQGLSLSTAEGGMERDLFDPFCHHLLVRETISNEVVGTYRILPFHQAKHVGGFYSETEFDLSNLQPLYKNLVEVGRSCIHQEYRTGGVISLLWSGLAQFMQANNYEYLMGCASIGMADGGENAKKVYQSLKHVCLSPDAWRVYPLNPLPRIAHTNTDNPVLPPLVKGYVRLGSYICGEPAWDPHFHTADLLMLLPMSKINRRYARHFLSQ